MAPPLLVPSSFVTMSPVRPKLLWKALACSIELAPSEPSTTSQEWWGAAGSILATTRRIFWSSSMRLPFVWSRPAVSTMTQSRPRLLAACTASKATAAGSAAGLARDHLEVRGAWPRT